MKDKITPYFLFAAGLGAGIFGASVWYQRMVVPLREELDKANTISKLILDTDRWLWETIDQMDEIESWAEELKERLNYIEMVIALYSVEE